MIDFSEVQISVQRALAEDIFPKDVSAALLPDGLTVRANILAREPLLIAGQPWVEAVCRAVDPSIVTHWFFQEGAWVDSPQVIGYLQGKAKSVLTAERTALNFLQTLSGTASKTYHYVQKLQGLKTKVLDTRKTLPGLRYAQKYAVTCAGGMNHRMGLYDAYLIKENHIRSLGSLTQAVLCAKRESQGLMIEVEVENLQQLEEALSAGPHRILLDNFDLLTLKAAVALREGYEIELEASGGISLDTIRSVAETGVDYISVGDLTKSVTAIDLSLLVEECQ